MLKIRQTEIGDIEKVVEIYEGAKIRMHTGGNPTQWASGTPNIDTLKRDMQLSSSYVLTDADGAVVGTFAYFTGAEQAYATLEGKWLNDAPYCTIHRIASDGHTRGIVKAAVEYCLNILPNLRIDTHRNNAPMRGVLNKLGFTYCGTIHLNNGEDDDERMAFQITK